MPSNCNYTSESDLLEPSTDATSTPNTPEPVDVYESSKPKISSEDYESTSERGVITHDDVTILGDSEPEVISSGLVNVEPRHDTDSSKTAESENSGDSASDVTGPHNTSYSTNSGPEFPLTMLRYDLKKRSAAFLYRFTPLDDGDHLPFSPYDPIGLNNMKQSFVIL
ncbi:uncharacterized protein MELLADRAFT_67321 [Melampsora larici-populina 98AG31]|uniref:Uncharacterized protein n=1 Tax=Melampsora larici-populina (strain 98AG31 / pathotype 3-4-7) TaxID=747676 RepID=F4S2N5_MELLP|nr:uncharacterized protein MELLADRAFT_67321 [Melampsora larici-populina 98AG31]EGG01097.1 hypothetical protein MELLADRAFT_67321 [Melampsora larici-populina 98AG31]